MASDPFVDDPHVERIAKALWSREPSGTAAVLVGAGFSRNAVAARATAGTMPGWNDIYAEMVAELYPAGSPGADRTREWLLRQTGSTSAYLRVAEEYEAQFRRGGLDKLILRHVPDQQFEPGELHRQLLQLPWADVMTTNWDTLLERAAQEVEERVYDVVRTAEEIPETRAPRIIKLHGSFPSSRPFIFTEEDFRTYPTRFAPFVNLAQQLAMENTLVLLGFSGDDPNFLYWSGWVRDRLGAKAPLIYLVGALDLSSSKRRMLEGRGVQPIDLARLPEFAAWPDTLRVQNANQWFLERLRASEPYPSRRWPRPHAGFVPPLRFVVPRPDSSAPPGDDGLTGGDAASKLKRLVEHCRQTRLVYPGWVVAPLETANYVWSRLRIGLLEVAAAIPGLPPVERLDALYEFDWQLQVSLVPLSLVLGGQAAHLLDELEPDFDSLDGHRADKFRALVLSVVRQAREEGDDALFRRWADWLTPRVALRGEERDRLTYEQCLQRRANLDFAALESQVSAWQVDGDPYWNVRRAGLLYDLGRDEEASELSVQALNEIRRRTSRGANDIPSWSRESYAMLLRSSFLYGDTGSWSAHKATRDRFDQRQDLLATRGCTGRQDFFRLTEALNQVPPPLLDPVERRTRFDIGSSSVKLRFAGASDAERRLLAYRAVRFLDETGIPSRMPNVKVGAQILEHASRWLIDVEPNAAIDALMRGGEKPGSDTFEEIFNRSTVASVDPHEADRLLGKLLRLANVAHVRATTPAQDRAFWQDRLRIAVELISRFVLRAPQHAADAIQLALRLAASPRLANQLGIPDEIARLVSRSAETLDESGRARELPMLFNTAVPEDPHGHGDALDLARAAQSMIEPATPTAEWTQAVELALDAASRPETRLGATRRLAAMKVAGLLDATQQRRLGEVLWEPRFLVGGLPSRTIWQPIAFLNLPLPEGTEPRSAIADATLIGELDDDKVLSGALESLLASDDFNLEDSELIAQIDRLRRFVEQHAPAPSHPDIMGDRRVELVEATSFIFAHLARRAEKVEAARKAITELAAVEKHPLRIEPAIPALVAMRVIAGVDGLDLIRKLIGSTEEVSERLLEQALNQMLRVEEGDAELQASIWLEVRTNLVARRPGFIVGALGFLIAAFEDGGGRVPTSIDADLSFALDLIRAEITPGQPLSHLLYEPFLVRFRAAALAGRLRSAGRGSHAMTDAWEHAAEDDPLPDVRRAWRIGLRTA